MAQSDGYVIGGYKNNIEDIDGWVLMIDQVGNLVWEYDLGKTEFYDGGASPILIGESLYVGSGIRKSQEGSVHLRRGTITKLDLDGNLIWENEYGKLSSGDGFIDLVADREGNILAVGDSDYELNPIRGSAGWVMRINTDGDSLFNKLFDASYNNHFDGLVYAWAIDTTLDGGFVTAGFVQGSDTMTQTGLQDIWVVKFDSNGCFDSTFNCIPDTSVGIVKNSNKPAGFTFYPNPANEKVSIVLNRPLDASINLFSIDGSLLISEQILNSRKKVLDLSKLSSGTYMIRVESASSVHSSIIIKH